MWPAAACTELTKKEEKKMEEGGKESWMDGRNGGRKKGWGEGRMVGWKGWRMECGKQGRITGKSA